ncbi:MAG: DNA mismatch repair protein MutS [Chloroflexi bacterium]|nr:DNA mismatch repair protein MutS [Chloroflexota bacterium]|tara:strand:- start:15735 stop:18302 length:2568 start_codon:yes stop_codon:yes gene_type:complete
MTTPARKQYLDIKSQYSDEILLFRMGDFYETFDEDAGIISRELDIALTTRSMGKNIPIPLAGIPYHSLEKYLSILIEKGYKVAICEQTSDPSESKGIVDREVVRVVTPGTITEDSLLDTKTNNYLVSLVIHNETAGISFIDITTTEFMTTQIPVGKVTSEISRLAPKELIVSSQFDDSAIASLNIYTSTISDHLFDFNISEELLKSHFDVTTLEPFGCDALPLATQAAGAILEYVKIHQREALLSIKTLRTYSADEFMIIDQQTRRNLELFTGGKWNSRSASLFSVLDKTTTAMGSRMLKKWISQPLINVSNIKKRQTVIKALLENQIEADRICEILKNISDLERLSTKLMRGNASPRDLLGISRSLKTSIEIKDILSDITKDSDSAWILSNFKNPLEICNLIDSAISDNAPISVGDGNTIKVGFSTDLDAIKNDSKIAKNYMASMEISEKERTGIKSLKIGHNKVFGYYIEISKSNIDLVPPEYIRKQTLVGGERFITPEMKEHEVKILNAQDSINSIEVTIFRQLCSQISKKLELIFDISNGIALTDVFSSLYLVAREKKYTQPKIVNNKEISILEGRHPIVENVLGSEKFISNDTIISNQENQILLITGPNMSGKSTYLKQVGIITLMAQIGSYVPAKEAKIGVVDRIFTRVGLQDDLTVGQSTFMVEMTESAYILNQATQDSLIILDEIGRGTSTYDGLAIAQSIAEHIHNHPYLGCKTLFATHYHEMTQLEKNLPRIKNFHIAVSENNEKVVFLRKVIPGGANKSYGVHVAKLAGLPNPVINRAWELLNELEKSNISNSDTHIESGIQLDFLNEPNHVLEEIKRIDIASLTPLEAITKLYELQKIIDSDS